MGTTPLTTGPDALYEAVYHIVDLHAWSCPCLAGNLSYQFRDCSGTVWVYSIFEIAPWEKNLVGLGPVSVEPTPRCCDSEGSCLNLARSINCYKNCSTYLISMRFSANVHAFIQLEVKIKIKCLCQVLTVLWQFVLGLWVAATRGLGPTLAGPKPTGFFSYGAIWKIKYTQTVPEQILNWQGRLHARQRQNHTWKSTMW